MTGTGEPFDIAYGPLVGTHMRVMTWNLWGRYGPWEARLRAISATLRHVDPDVVALQEVWADDTRSQAAELADVLGGFDHVYAPGFEINGAWSGNAVLSRWPIGAHRVGVLPMEGGGAVDTDEGEKRLVLIAPIDGPRGPVQVFCTHLSWRADHSGVRREQVRVLCELVAATRPRSFPAILCGDLNATPASDEVRMLTGDAPVPVPGVVFRDAWESAGEGPGDTWSNTNGFAAASLDLDRRIDHILVGWPKAGGVGHVLRAWRAGDEPVDGILGSDHYAVVAELRY